ncbi:MAG TPA: TonB-dependent receptor [Thermoanaerobaculia bacterium]|nr:TonB-dependent receptor [Thermoanaerobaculia bacterium]
MKGKWMYLLIALALLPLAAGLAQAQGTGKIAGKVTRLDGAGLAGVTVRIQSLDLSTQTDATGAYVLDGVPPGTYEVTFGLSDHTKTEAAVVVAAGSARTLDQKVDWDLSFAETITVYSASRKAERITEAPAAVTVVPEEEIALQTPTGQVPKLLEFTPGVDFTQSGLYDFNFNVRGFNSSLNRRILTLIDGRDPSVPFLGAQEWAAVSFPMDELATVELVRGPGSALYGANAFSGVLNMTTRSPRGDTGGKVRLTGGELGTARGDLRYATELGAGWYGRVVGGYQQSDDFTRSRNQTVEYSTICASAAQTNCLRREAQGLARDQVKIHYGGLRLDRYFSDSQVLTVEGGTAGLGGPTFLTGIGRVQVTDVNRPWGRVNFNTLHWNLLGYYDSRKAEKQVALSSGALLFEDSSNLHGELEGNTGFLGGKGFLVGGLAYRKQKVDTADNTGFQTLMDSPKNEHSEAVFGQVEYSLTSSLKAVVAARVDDSTLHDRQFSPKGSLVWAATPTQTFRLTYNKAFQVPNYSEFFLRAPAGAPITAFAPLEAALAPFLGGHTLGLTSIPLLARGNNNLGVEKIRSYEAGYSGIFGAKLYLTIDYYQSRMENFVTDLLPGVNPAFTPYTPPSFLPAPVAATVLNTLRGGLGPNFVGLANLNGQPALVFSYANAGVVDTQGIDVAFNYYVTDRVLADFSYSWFDFTVKSKNERDQLLPNGPGNKASGGVSYRGDRWNSSVKVRWVEAFPWAAGVFVGDVPAYTLVDLGVTYKLSNNWQIGLDVNNLLDKQHFESFGGDLLRRRALAHVAYSW